MTIKLKKAENLTEAYQVFDTQHPLSQDQREFYVELYQTNLTELRNELIYNIVPHKTFFVTGQSGNGKSTAFNFLPDNEIKEKYEVKYLRGREVFALDDVDAIDVIMMIGFALINENNDLERKFLGELEELKKVKLGRLVKEHEKRGTTWKQVEGKAAFGAKLPFLGILKFEPNIFAKYKIEKETRNSIREIFTLNKLELIEKVNDIIGVYNEKVLQEKKKLLIVVDDLEKMRVEEQITELFVDNSYIFDKIQSTKIVTFPVHLATRHGMYQNASMLGIRIDENPHEQTKTSEGQKNREKLKNVIWQRLASQDIVQDDAANEAVKFSGGNVRFLMEIMQKAALNAINLGKEKTGTNLIAPSDVQSAVEKISSLASLSVMSRVKVLKYVMDNHCEPDQEDKDFIRSVLDNTIFAYFNGHPWYDLNPMIRASVETYAKKHDTGKEC